MNYYDADKIKKKGHISLLTDKIISGGGIMSSVRSTISDKAKARLTSFKKNFDIMNIAKVLTGGSNLAPALVGKLLGRSKEDMRYFTGKKQYTNQRRESTYFNNYSTRSQGSKKATLALEKILSFMETSREKELQERDTSDSFKELNQKRSQDRHKEVVDVFIEATKVKRKAEKDMAKEAKKREREAKKAEKETKKDTGKKEEKPAPAKEAPPTKEAPAPTKEKPAPAKEAPAPAKEAPPTAKPVETAPPVPTAAPAPPVVTPKPPIIKPAAIEAAKTAAKAGGIIAAGGLLMPGAEAASAIDKASKQVGVDRALMYAMAKQESGFDPSAGAKTSSAKGLYQFISGTWNDMVGKYGTKYTILKRGPYDAEANAIAGALFIKENSDILAKSNIPINATNVYAAHFLGAGGAKTLLTANPNIDATKLMPKAAAANEYIFYKTSGKKILKDQPKTVSEVVETLFQKVGQYQEKYSQVLNAQNVGTQISDTSHQNADIKKDMSQGSFAGGPVIIQNNNTTQAKNVTHRSAPQEQLNPTMR